MVIARSMGYRVHMRHLDDPNIRAVTDPSDNSISITWGLTPAEMRSTIAHELGHIHHGHVGPSARHEREADAWAADLLVNAADYAELEREGMCEHDIADELGVTPKIIDTWQRYCLQRIGQMTYGTRGRGRFTNALARALA